MWIELFNEIVKVMTASGLGGALVFAIGGTLVFFMLFYLLTSGSYVNATAFTVYSFFGFLLLGLGLWLIVNDVKPKQNP